MKTGLVLDQIIKGDNISILNSMPENSVDLIFADPPYNLQLKSPLWRPNMTMVSAVEDEWDKFEDFKAYDEFSINWLIACKRVLKENGTIWVIGSYHNIYRIGKIMQDIGFWILNDVIWIKSNPMPNFRGVRFTNAHETLLWASQTKSSKYTFNYHAMKSLSENEKQMRSDWDLPNPDQWKIPICSGNERIKINGKKAHSTQKPESLLYRVLLSSSNPGDTVLDPFLGTGTTCAVAKKLRRHWIGIEKEEDYIQIAQTRVDNTPVEEIADDLLIKEIFDVSDKKRRAPKVNFASLLEVGFILPGQKLFFREDLALFAYVMPDGRLHLPDGNKGSIHQTGRMFLGGSPCNGWDNWYYMEGDLLISIDSLRKQYIDQFLHPTKG